MEARMGSPLFLKSEKALGSSLAVVGALHEPLTLTLLRLGKHRPQQDLRRVVGKLAQQGSELQGVQAAVEEACSWARREQGNGRFPELAPDELVAVRLCSLAEPDLLLRMNRALFDFQPSEEARFWEDVAGGLAAGLAKLKRYLEKPGRLFRSVWVPQRTWEEYFESREGSALCFAGVQSASPQEEWHFLSMLVQGCVPCVLEFDDVMVQEAASVRAVSEGSGSDEWLLPPYTRGSIRSIAAEPAPEAYGGLEVFRVRIRGLRTVEPSREVFEASPERTLAGALLVGLNASLPGASSVLLTAVTGCFQALAVAAEVKSQEAIQVVWKGYWECLLEGCHSWKELHETVHSGVVTAARVAVVDVALAARGVAKRVLGFESCMDRRAMEEQRARLAQDRERLKKEAVSVARDQVAALQMETLTDPEAFLRFIEHDPVKAFEAAPAAARAYMDAGPAQRVLLFAKLMGLVAMAGGLLAGEPKVRAAFDSPLPLREDPWQTLLAARTALSDEAPRDKEEAARRAVSLMQVQRLILARTRLLIVGGAPDVGKTTVLREVFGFKHLAAGLSPAGRTEKVTFELHPDGDEQLRPVYVVDTPGFGDAECLYRNDMGRLLLGAGNWIPGGITLLWVMKAGRNVRQEADEFLRTMATSHAVLVVVTHVDQLFEERYRDVGPKWREGALKGVPKTDKRWEEHRRGLMAELGDEVTAGVRSVVGRESDLETVYACLGGWMASDGADEEDEFAASPPWPWARQELKAFFHVKSRHELRCWLDAKLGL